ncbi:MAG: exo-alpha-sialidase [Acidobacteria bacterium]|nr:exo-alpha-sialidase [Acidobacteriota bacterium]
MTRLHASAIVAGLAAMSMIEAPAAAQHDHPPAPPPATTPADESTLRGPTKSSKTPTVAFDRKNRLWAVWVEGSKVFASVSADAGRTFGRAVALTRAPEPIDANGESRPKIAIGPGNEIYVTWTTAGTQPFTGYIRFSRSLDGGRTFTTPVTLNDDERETGHRFDTIHVGPTGIVYVIWIDKRDLDKATEAHQPYAGAALYYTRSTDRGASFSPNAKLKDHVCECCRIAVAFDGDRPVVFWRDVIDGRTRDHAMIRFSDALTPGPPARATWDGWDIDACPHHGPSLSIAADGTYHMVWFTGEGPQGVGAFYARSADGGRTLTPPMQVGSPNAFGHGVAFSHGSDVYVAARDIVRPAGMSVQILTSSDGGATWSPPAEALRTAGAADHPFLLAGGGQVYLSWFTAEEGLRVVPVHAQGRAR